MFLVTLRPLNDVFRFATKDNLHTILQGTFLGCAKET